MVIPTQFNHSSCTLWWSQLEAILCFPTSAFRVWYLCCMLAYTLMVTTFSAIPIRFRYSRVIGNLYSSIDEQGQITTMVLSDRVYINVGGQRFLTTWTTLQQPNCSRLSQLSIADPTYDSDNNEFYFDRSSCLFESIIDLHRTGTLHLPRGVCVPKVLDEMRFWDVPVENVACCCWTRIREHQSNTARIKELIKIQNYDDTTTELEKSTSTDTTKLTPPATKQRVSEEAAPCIQKAVNYIFRVLNRPRSSHLAMVSIRQYKYVFFSIASGIRYILLVPSVH